MNYRHAFHAGNFADVVKHVVLSLCLDRLNAKDKPYRFIDTHAGVGAYDLTGDEARRSPEWRDGVARLWMTEHGAPDAVRAALAPYMTVLRGMNPDGNLVAYPGSPAIATRLMREGDAIRLCELHPESAEKLREAVGGDRRVKIEERDGYEALGAYVPPPERRGLVLIDPPFEEGSAERRLDFERMLRVVRKAVKRWPGGVYLLWRPIKNIDAVAAFDGELASVLIEELGMAPDKLLAADLWVRDPGRPGPLAGAGLVVLNPPFGLTEHLKAALPWLANLMDQSSDDEEIESGWRLVSPEAEPDAG
ncbi:MAG: 23S rRNA (adenine(2030)-N(6))-methyltransferase RlmJ [Alphaproteobacteria bacterium]|nr:23S rRNA (adenine(2030)-N(6))-methyltransferase RlmJ [Alphaproteobacteria bacterium]